MGLKLRMLVENQLSEEYFSGINICDERDTHSRGLDGVYFRTNLHNLFIIGIPLHIFNKIPVNIRSTYKAELLTD